MRISPAPLSVLAGMVFATFANAQLLVSANTTTDTVVAFSPIDGSVVDANYFPIGDAGGTKVSVIQVNDEVWISEQTGDRIVRFDPCGNEIGVIGPTFTGGGLDNIRGMTFTGGVVYVTNDGASNGATPDSLVTFDAAGNHLATIPLTNTISPYSVLPWQGDILVAGSSNNEDIHRYTTAGVSVGTFHDSTSLSFVHSLAQAFDGNVWSANFTTGGISKLDATTGAVLSSFTASNARGVAELANGNILWTNSSGAHVYDMGTMTSTLVFAGAHAHISLVQTDFACNKAFGAGCHDFFGNNSNLFELFATLADGKAALDGNAMQFLLTTNGYVANWLPGAAGALYVAPSGSATVVADGSATTETFTPSAAVPVPGGVATEWTVSSEGVLTAGPVGNEGTDSTPTLAETATESGLGFYTWFSQNPTESGSGKIKWEEVAGVIYVTFDGVECALSSPVVAPSTYQFQLDTTTGNVTMVWVSMTISSSTSDMLVGCSLAGSGMPPASQSLAAAMPAILGPDTSLTPMSLSGAPRPVINPSTTVTYTATDVPEYLPGSNVYLGTMFLSVNPLPGGFDLNGILTTVPGCNAYIATLDLDLGGVLNVVPMLSWTFTYDNVNFAPGNVIAAQAVALFDPSVPLVNGEAGGFLLSNGVLTTTQVQ